MRDAKRRRDGAGRPARHGDRKARPKVERLEARRVLSADAATIFGTVHLDPTGAGGFQGPGEPNVPVLLYRDGAADAVAVTATDAQGHFSFPVTQAGRYTVVEWPQGGETFRNSRAASQVFPTSGSGTWQLHVTVPDLNNVWVNYNGVIPASALGIKVQIGSKTLDNSVGPLAATLGTAAHATDLNAGFQTYCLDDLSALSYGGGESFRVVPESTASLTDAAGNPVAPDRAARIAYLVNAHGSEHLGKVDGAGLQLAIWELLYDTGASADFNAGTFRVVAPLDPADASLVTQAEARAVAYFNESAGHADLAYLLDARALNNTAVLVGFQSISATARLDFVNVPAPAQSSLAGYVYCDPDQNGIKEPAEMGIPGVTITLTGTDAQGHAVSRTFQTTAAPDAAGHGAGYYHFDALAPGTYTITEGVAAGYIHVNQTQGTPGTGTVSTRTFSNIRLGANVHGENNNFGEELPPVDFSVVLTGIHHQQSVITLTLTGDVDPVQVRNPANYSVVSLGPDRSPIFITAVVYNPATRQIVLLPDHHLNIHYHYEITARLPGNACTPPSVHSKIFGGFYHPVMIDVSSPTPLPYTAPAAPIWPTPAKPSAWVPFFIW